MARSFPAAGGFVAVFFAVTLLLSSESCNRTAAHRTIRTVDQIRRLTAEDLQNQIPVKLTGTITYADRTWKLLFLQDATGGVRVENVAIPEIVHSPQRAEITGIAATGGQAPMVTRATVRLLDGPAPALAVAFNPSQPFAPDLDLRMVEVRGEITSVALAGTGRLAMKVQSGPRQIDAWILNQTGADFTTLLHSTVRIRGVLAASYDASGVPQRIKVWVENISAVQVESRGPAVQRSDSSGSDVTVPAGAITTVKGVHDLSPQAAALASPVHLAATVTFYDP